MSAGLQARLALRRIRAGQYEAHDGTVQVVRRGEFLWVVLGRGRVLSVLGVREFSSLREAHGKLADAADILRGR